MAKNKWIFYTAAIAVILLIVILSLALPGMNPKNEGSEKDLHETTGYQEEVTTGKPITVPPETVTETKKETQKETAQTTQETTRRETTQETTREETTPEETTENKPAEKTTSETTKESETVVEAPYIDESDYPTPKDIKAKAVYLNAGAAGTPSVINYIIDLAKNTELNAVVIDIKDGPIAYPSEVKYAKEYGLYGVYYYPDELIAKLHDNDIYVIGRLVCFRDPALAEKKPELAIHTASGEIWKENGTTAWLNPYHPDVQKYLLDLATEAAKKGFDEIQFDYIRFPTGTYGKDYYGENLPSKTEAVEAFLDAAVKALRPYGVKVTADIFGIVGLSQADGYAIGQHLETIGKNIDYICPMVYPSHYANGSNSVMGNGTGTILNGVLYKAPDLNPYEIVYGTLIRMRERIAKVENYKASLRPYLQAFSASYLPKGYYQRYEAEQIRQQIQAVYDAGYEEWILWDHSSNYPRDAFLPKKSSSETEKNESDRQ
jgi:hypothetical protein